MEDFDFSHLKSIQDSIRALYSKLGNARIMTFNHDFKNPDFMIEFRQDAANVQHLARVVAEHYRLSIRTILVRFKDLEHYCPVNFRINSTGFQHESFH